MRKKPILLIFIAIIVAGTTFFVSSCSKNNFVFETKVQPYMADEKVVDSKAENIEETKTTEKEFYTDEDFGIVREISSRDENNNGIDDYTDILEGALIQASLEPFYISEYYIESDGYPPDGEGVCTDLVWRALSHAGYDLKEMIDEDIENDVYSYPAVEGEPDPYIDFRRVRNLNVFFSKYLTSLTTDVNQIDQWQAGDIVIIGDDDHIAIISDIRNEEGVPFILHSAEDLERDYHEDYLQEYSEEKGIIAHFRWNFLD